MGGKAFTKAYRLYRRRKYAELIRLLEPQIFRYRDNPEFYYLLGMSCLRTGDFGGAYSYLRRGADLRPEHAQTHLGLALVHLKRQETNETLKDWFHVLDIEPRNRYAKKGLKLLKKLNDSQDISQYIESGKHIKLIPREGRLAALLASAAVIILVAVLGLGLYYVYGKVVNGTQDRPEIAQITLEPGTELVDLKGQFAYILTEKEITESFERAKKHFNSYEDNLAQRELNRIKYSNASQKVKDKAVLLSTFIKAPTFNSLKNGFEFTEVQAEPLLYENCFVRWKGRVSNLKVTDTAITFDFLIGYEDNKVLLGIVPVSLDFAAKLSEDYPLEVLGKVVLSQKSFGLKAISIHQLAR